ncbi:MAG: S9 family peptidase [Candidatus Eremiobacteraeota bacterium]|nr:S9 family peptidase [Candidatus Eremiobacteraeota bacterium]
MSKVFVLRSGEIRFPMVRRFVIVVFLVLSCGLPARAAFELSLDSVFAATPPWGAQPSHIVWAPDSRSFLYVLPTQDPQAPLAVHQYDVESSRDRILIEPGEFGNDSTTPANTVWSPDSHSVAFTEKSTLYVRDLATGIDRKIYGAAADPQWSPRGDALAFVHHGDLYAAHLRGTLEVRRLTSDGKPGTILNGEVDWLYGEEFGTEHGYAWSPRGERIAYVRMDEAGVTAFPIVDFITEDNRVSYQRYPLAGERNPAVTLHLIDISANKDSLVYDAAVHDEYLPFVNWNGDSLQFETLDRAQQRVRVLAFGAAKTTTLYEQTDDKWVDAIPLPAWRADGSSYWLLDRAGTSGLYLRRADATLKRMTGSYRVYSYLGYDSAGAVAYVLAAYPTRRERSVLAVSGDGDVRVVAGRGMSHAVALAPNRTLLVDTSSSWSLPPQTALVSARSGQDIAILARRNTDLATALLPVQPLQVRSSFGMLDAYMLRPPDFTSSKRYPVVVYVYGGPAAPTTENVFDEERSLYNQLLARRGYIVFSVDGPGSQVDSDAGVRSLFHNLGPGSFAGQQAGVDYLRGLPYVDPSRIGIWGKSFGGYEAAFAVTHSGSFKAAAAIAPVSDWRLYDSAYTERYMGKPQTEKQGYDASSLLLAAHQLQGSLLILHGTSDNNVHLANTVQLVQQFIGANKTGIDLMLYPRAKHSGFGLAQRRDIYEHMLQWWQTHL